MCLSFFMCYEDIPKGAAAGISGEEEEGLAPGNLATRIWSIGRWGQTIPNPDTEDIYDWYALLELVALVKRVICSYNDIKGQLNCPKNYSDLYYNSTTPSPDPCCKLVCSVFLSTQSSQDQPIERHGAQRAFLLRYLTFDMFVCVP